MREARFAVSNIRCRGLTLVSGAARSTIPVETRFAQSVTTIFAPIEETDGRRGRVAVTADDGSSGPDQR